jgi:hypothetical protein
MDVRLVSNTPYSFPRSAEDMEIFDGKPPVDMKPVIPQPGNKEDSEIRKIREQVVMNLEEVQNFLYMIIGSKLRVDTDHRSIGSSVNTVI